MEYAGQRVRGMRQGLSRVVVWMRRRWKLLLVAAEAAALIGGLIVALWIFDPVYDPARQAAELAGRLAAVPEGAERERLRKDIVQYEMDNQIKIWTTVVQGIGALVLAVGGFFTWRNLQETRRKLDIDREGQITNRYTQAGITQAGIDKLAG